MGNDCFQLACGDSHNLIVHKKNLSNALHHPAFAKQYPESIPKAVGDAFSCLSVLISNLTPTANSPPFGPTLKRPCVYYLLVLMTDIAIAHHSGSDEHR